MGALKLGKMTFGSLFKKPETVLYPIETKPKPEGLKGHIEVDVNECILCGLCSRSCSTGCITVDRQAGTWQIFRLQCVQCGYCTTVCPKKCLSMKPNYMPATTQRLTDSYDVVAQRKDGKPKSGSGKAAEPEKETIAADSDLKPAETVDAQLESLMKLMDAEKAEKVRAAL